MSFLIHVVISVVTQFSLSVRFSPGFFNFFINGYHVLVHVNSPAYAINIQQRTGNPSYAFTVQCHWTLFLSNTFQVFPFFPLFFVLFFCFSLHLFFVANTTNRPFDLFMLINVIVYEVWVIEQYKSISKYGSNQNSISACHFFLFFHPFSFYSRNSKWLTVQ